MPTANSGGWKGMWMVAKPIIGVIARIATSPYSKGKGCLMAASSSSVFSTRPLMIKMMMMQSVSTML